MKARIVEFVVFGEDTEDDDGRSITIYNDVTPLIRCGECKYWQDNNGGYPHESCGWRQDETPDGADYCSKAERRED